MAYNPVRICVFLAIGRNNKSYLSKVLVFVMKKQYAFCEAGTKILDVVLRSIFYKTCGGNSVLKPGLCCLKAVSLSEHKFSSFE